MKVHFERIVIPNDTSFKVARLELEGFDSPYHYHPEIEITLIESSSGTRVVGDSVESFLPGDLCLLGSNLPHFYFNTVPGNAAALVAQFKPSLLDSLRAAPEMKKVFEMLQKAERGLAFPQSTSEKLAPLLIEMHSSKGADRILCLLKALSLLAQDNSAKELASHGFASRAGVAQQRRINKACQIVVDNFTHDISHKQVAKEIGLSPSALSRLFRKTTNRTFSAFLNETRLGHACRLLLNTDMQIIDICYASGFRNLSNFNRRFKEKYGISPRNWRQMISDTNL